MPLMPSDIGDERARRPVYLVGAGGHGRVVADILTARGAPPVAFVDREPKRLMVGTIPVITGTQAPDSAAAVIISIGDNFVRETLAASFQMFATAIHPAAIVAPDAVIGEGTVVMAGAVVNAGARIGRHCIINTRSVVDHDCLIDDFVHLAPGAVLGGSVTVGRGTFVGLGAAIIHGIAVGDYAVIGAGSTVIRDIESLVLAVGSPARVVRTRSPGDRYL